MVSELTMMEEAVSNQNILVSKFRTPEGRSQPIIVKFNDNQKKVEFIKKAKTVRPSIGSSKIFIGDHLLAKSAQVYKMVKQLRRDNMLRCVWIRNDEIFVKKTEGAPARRIREQQELLQYIGDLRRDYQEEENVLGKGTERRKRSLEKGSPEGNIPEKHYGWTQYGNSNKIQTSGQKKSEPVQQHLERYRATGNTKNNSLPGSRNGTPKETQINTSTQ